VLLVCGDVGRCGGHFFTMSFPVFLPLRFSPFCPPPPHKHTHTSGCVTSAESVLIQEQSYSKLLLALQLPHKCVVVTLSPQTVASLAAFMDAPSVVDTFLRVAACLKSLGVRYVIDAAAGGDVVLLEAREEFITRWHRERESHTHTHTHTHTYIKNSLPSTFGNYGGQRRHTHSDTHTHIYVSPLLIVSLSLTRYCCARWEASRGIRNPTWESPPVTSPHSSSQYLPAGSASPLPLPAGGLSSVSAVTPHPLPVVASHCPGFICYAEKTTPQILPYVSTIKSAQQIIGTVLKCIIPQRLQQQQQSEEEGEGVAPGSHLLPPDPLDIYHVSVQPCFDKKLEGSRQVCVVFTGTPPHAVLCCAVSCYTGGSMEMCCAGYMCCAVGGVGWGAVSVVL
jgi:iron only hydrogenase large subunit-like protein